MEGAMLAHSSLDDCLIWPEAEASPDDAVPRPTVMQAQGDC